MKKITIKSSQLIDILSEAVMRAKSHINENNGYDEDERFTMDKDHFEQEITIYLRNESELHDTVHWLVNAMTKKLKRKERVSLAHLKDSQTVKKLTTSLLKHIKKNRGDFDIKLVQGLTRGKEYEFVRETIANHIIEELKENISYNDYDVDMSLIQEARENDSYPRNAKHFFQRIGSDFFDYLETQEAYDDLKRFISDIEGEDDNFDKLMAFGSKKIIHVCFKNWLNKKIEKGEVKPYVEGNPIFDFMRKEYVGDTRQECYNLTKYFMKHNVGFNREHSSVKESLYRNLRNK